MKFLSHSQVSTTYYWTEHVRQKMKYYALSEQRIKRVIRNPVRIEKGIAPNTIAAMQPILKAGKTTQEIWTMYQDRAGERIVITAWRYPGKSPLHGELQIPEDIMRELTTNPYVENLIHSSSS